MMKKTAFVMIILAISHQAAAQPLNTVSLSKSYISATGLGSDDVTGLNAKYFRLAPGREGGFMASLSVADDSTDTKSLAGTAQDSDISYLSFGVGPLYRPTSWTTLYALAGLSAAEVKHSAPSRERSDQSFMVGVGLRVELSSRLGLDVHYETSSLEAAGISVGDRVLNAGITLSF